MGCSSPAQRLTMIPCPCVLIGVPPANLLDHKYHVQEQLGDSSSLPSAVLRFSTSCAWDPDKRLCLNSSELICNHLRVQSTPIGTFTALQRKFPSRTIAYKGSAAVC